MIDTLEKHDRIVFDSYSEVPHKIMLHVLKPYDYGSTGLTPGDPGVYWWSHAGDVDHYYH